MRREVPERAVSLNTETVDKLLGGDNRYPWERYNYAEKLERTTYFPIVPVAKYPVSDASALGQAEQQTEQQSYQTKKPALDTAPDESAARKPDNQATAAHESVTQPYTPSTPSPFMRSLLDHLYQNVPRHNPRRLARFALDRYHPHDFTD